jgi:disulfide bond formation protein DsbB
MSTQRLFALIALFAAFLAASGFILQYGFHVIPCQMCWWQRYAHYTILAAALGGLWVSSQPNPPSMRVRAFAGAIVGASALGLSYAIWQFAAQQNLLPWPPSCKSEGAQLLSTAAELISVINNTPIVPCDKENFTLLGLSLAAWNIPAMLATLLASIRIFQNRTA